MKIAIANQKGGVGKTTTTMNLAAGLVRRGKKVLCIDLDAQANLSNYLGYVPEDGMTISALLHSVAARTDPELSTAIKTSQEGIDYIPSDMALASLELTCQEPQYALNRLLERDEFTQYDYILVDCLPSLGVVLTNALFACDSVLIPVQTQKYAADGLADLMHVIRLAGQATKRRIDIVGVLLTMFDRTAMARAVCEAVLDAFGNRVFDCVIPRLAEVAVSTNKQISLVANRKSLCGMKYQMLADELIARCEGICTTRVIPIEQIDINVDDINLQDKAERKRLQAIAKSSVEIKVTPANFREGSYTVITGHEYALAVKALESACYLDCMVENGGERK